MHTWRSHFHHGYEATGCGNCVIHQSDFDNNDVGRVQTCDLGGLPDLDSGNAHVQQVHSVTLMRTHMMHTTIYLSAKTEAVLLFQAPTSLYNLKRNTFQNLDQVVLLPCCRSKRSS